MQYNMIEKVKKFHQEAGFVIKVSNKTVGIMAITYPGDLLKVPHLMPLVVGYDLNENNIIKKTSSDSSSHIEVNCPNYARRLVIITDVMLECSKRGLSEQLLCSDSEFDLMYTDLKNYLTFGETNELDKEAKLEDILVTMIANNEMEQLVDIDIEDGYHIICETLNVGGI